MPRILNILIVEDDKSRVDRLTEWIPADMRIVWARSGGAALGVLKRARMNDYAGILLDHDLQGNARTEEDCALDGRDIVDEIIRRLSRDPLIMVHSMNPQHAPQMVTRLDDAGFSVSRMPFAVMTQETFVAWCDEVRDNSDTE